MVEFLNGYSDLWIYALLFFLLFLCGIGFPMAEELVLLAGGVLVASGVLDPLFMCLSTFLGVIVGDVLLFWLGRGIGTRLTTSAYFMRWFSPQRLAKGAHPRGGRFSRSAGARRNQARQALRETTAAGSPAAKW